MALRAYILTLQNCNSQPGYHTTNLHFPGVFMDLKKKSPTLSNHPRTDRQRITLPLLFFSFPP